MRNTRFYLHAGIVLMLATGAQTATACSLDGWSRVVGAQNLSTGSPADGHRRYQGECGMRVSLDGTASGFVEDGSPDGETAYMARFYLFTGDAELRPGDWVDVFTAFRGTSSPAPEVSVRLSGGANGPTLTVRAADGTGIKSSAPVTVRPGWHGVVLSWQQASGVSNGLLKWSVDGAGQQGLAGLDNRSHAIESARLGVVSRRGGSGRLDFDAFESHRSSPAEMLLAGDANDDQRVDAADLVSVIREYNGGALAPGQPDCDGDGAVDRADMNCIAHAIIGW